MMEEEEEKERLLKLSVKASTKALQNPNRAGVRHIFHPLGRVVAQTLLNYHCAILYHKTARFPSQYRHEICNLGKVEVVNTCHL